MKLLKKLIISALVAVGAAVCMSLAAGATNPDTYTVEFYVNGEKQDDLTQTNIPEGGKATKPQNVSVNGISIINWYESQTSVSTWNFDTRIVSEAGSVLDNNVLKLYAITNVVYFVVEPDPTPIYTLNTSPGHKIENPSPIDGVNYIYWRLTEGAWDFDEDTMPNYESITLYATKVIVSFNNNGRGANIPDKTAGYGTKFTAPQVADDQGYRVTGWYTDAECSADSKWNFDQMTADIDHGAVGDIIPGDIYTCGLELFAKWEPIPDDEPDPDPDSDPVRPFYEKPEYIPSTATPVETTTPEPTEEPEETTVSETAEEPEITTVPENVPETTTTASEEVETTIPVDRGDINPHTGAAIGGITMLIGAGAAILISKKRK